MMLTTLANILLCKYRPYIYTFFGSSCDNQSVVCKVINAKSKIYHDQVQVLMKC